MSTNQYYHNDRITFYVIFVCIVYICTYIVTIIILNDKLYASQTRIFIANIEEYNFEHNFRDVFLQNMTLEKAG